MGRGEDWDGMVGSTRMGACGGSIGMGAEKHGGAQGQDWVNTRLGTGEGLGWDCPGDTGMGLEKHQGGHGERWDGTGATSGWGGMGVQGISGMGCGSTAMGPGGR